MVSPVTFFHKMSIPFFSLPTNFFFQLSMCPAPGDEPYVPSFRDDYLILFHHIQTSSTFLYAILTHMIYLYKWKLGGKGHWKSFLSENMRQKKHKKRTTFTILSACLPSDLKCNCVACDYGVL